MSEKGSTPEAAPSVGSLPAKRGRAIERHVRYMKEIILSSEPLPDTSSTISLDFFDPKESGIRGTKLSERKGREGRITFNADGYQIFSLSSTSTPASGISEDLYLIWLPFTLHKIPGTGHYEEITFQIHIEDRQTTAFDLFPRHITNTVEKDLVATVSPDFTITPIGETGNQQIERCFRFIDLHPIITAFGEGETFFYWLYEASSEQKGVVPGTKHALFVLRTPRGTPTVAATISGETMIVKPAFGVWKSERRETESCQVHWNLSAATPFYEMSPLQTYAASVTRSVKEMSNENTCDVCIVCALADEGRTFIQIAEQQCNVQFEKIFDKRLKLEYYRTRILNMRGEQLTVCVSWPARYGPWEMSLHLRPLFEAFRPRFAGMSGICAGDKKQVRLGDLIVAERAYFYESGKFILEQNGKRVQQPDIDLHTASQEIRRFIQTFDYKHFFRTLAPWKSIAGQHDPAYAIGTMASGSAVRADHPFDEVPFLVRDTRAIDMEGAAFYRAALDFPGMRALVAKGVSDFADSNKNDSHRYSASAISAMYMLAFVQQYVTSDHMPRNEYR